MTVDLQICECSEGDILAADVLSKNGVKLVACNTTVNEYILKKLRAFGIENVMVYDPPLCVNSQSYQYKRLEKGYRNAAFQVKEMIHDLAGGKRLDYGKVDAVTDIIYEHINDQNNDNIIKCLSSIKNTDEYTYLHSVNVAFYSMLAAKWMDLPVKDIKKAVQSGFLHDIGKAKIPLRILNKAAPLTKEEFNVIKKHPIYGYYILDESVSVDIEIKRAVLLHHERVNRSGYPFNISAGNIGLITRIVSIADVYDAMTSDRVYKKKATPFAAFKMFLTDGYANFDTQVATEFVSHMSAYLTGSEVRLSNGAVGTIVYVPPQDVLSPVVCAGSDYFCIQDKGITITDFL